MRRLAALLLVLPFPVVAQANGAGVTPTVPARAAMATVPAGSYAPLYALEEGKVSVASFRMDRRAVTRRDFAAFVAAEPRWRRSEVPPVFAEGPYLGDWASDLEPGGDPASPVTGVSWFAARAYCALAGKRLPTVDEWEYAARADETRADASVDPSHSRRILDLYTQRSRTPPPVGSIFRNVHGIEDMHGLVWEWVADFNTVIASGDSRGGDGGDSRLYCAAGAEGATDREDYPAFLRYAFRSSLKGRSVSSALGFRCAADL